MAKISENKLAQKVIAREGKKVSLPIGQVKEVIRITLDVLALEENPSDVMALLEKHSGDVGPGCRIPPPK